MAWIKKVSDVVVDKELEGGISKIAETNAYNVEIEEVYLKQSNTDGSEAVSLAVAVKTKDGEVAKTFFTIMGKDGNTYFESTVGGKKVKKQHFGLSIANSLFKIVLGKEIFDCEPSETTYRQYNKDTKEMETLEADGFPELVGKTVGVCAQMVRKIKGKDSTEYPEIVHFFDTETGLFADEEDNGGKRKLDRWLASAKDYKIIEEEAPKSSFRKKADSDGDDKPAKRKWGK